MHMLHHATPLQLKDAIYVKVSKKNLKKQKLFPKFVMFWYVWEKSDENKNAKKSMRKNKK